MSINKIFLIALVLLLSSCSLINKRTPLQLEPIPKPIPKGITSINVNIKKSQYLEYLQRGESINKARFVPVYSRGGGLEEFRLFDIKQGSVFELVGLESLDIIVAANEYVIPGGNVFWNYLNLLAELSEGNIEIRRNGIPLLIKVKLY